MYRSSDGKITADSVSSIGDAVFPAADISMFNLPVDGNIAKCFFENLYNSPSQNHILLLFNRQSRKEKLTATKNISNISGFEFLDVVHLWYEKPSTSSNIGLLPVAEEAYLLYKGDIPNVKNTSWFSDGNPNATNMWGLSPAEHENRSATYHKKFAWEIALLLYTMKEPLAHNRIIYGLEDDYEHVLKFAKTYNINVHFVANSDNVAKQIISRYEVL